MNVGTIVGGATQNSGKSAGMWSPQFSSHACPGCLVGGCHSCQYRLAMACRRELIWRIGTFRKMEAPGETQTDSIAWKP